MKPIGGMGMMLKSLGVDPEQIEKAAREMPALLSGINARFQNIESKLSRILEILEGEVIDESVTTIQRVKLLPGEIQ